MNEGGEDEWKMNEVAKEERQKDNGPIITQMDGNGWSMLSLIKVINQSIN